MQFIVLILLVVHVENMNLLLLLFRLDHGWLRTGQGLIGILDDDFNDWLWGFYILGIMAVIVVVVRRILT